MSYFHARGTTGIAVLLFLVGLVLGNIVFLSMGFAILIFLALSLAIQEPSGVVIVRDPAHPTTSYVGQVIERRCSITVYSGIGPVIVHDDIPEQFELVEGSNYRVFWKWLRPLQTQLAYKIRCTKRGIYATFAPRHELRHPMNIRTAKRGGGELDSVLTVKPRLISLRRMRDPRTVSNIPLPIGSVAKGGIPTTDFREIREYLHGDPHSSINWKATARFSSRGTNRPLVNEFEKEGKKMVWLIIDLSTTMSTGTSVADALDYAVEAASALSYFYLERGCSVGLYLCSEQGTMRPPDVGKRQYQVILKELIGLHVSDSPQPLAVAAKKCGRYSIGTNPLFIIITCLTTLSAPSVIRGVKEAGNYVNLSRNKRSVIVVDVVPFGLLSHREEEKLGSEVLKALTGPESRAMWRLGALLVRWDPAERNFSSVMLRGLKA